jgi:hypothetical protein
LDPRLQSQIPMNFCWIQILFTAPAKAYENGGPTDGQW